MTYRKIAVRTVRPALLTFLSGVVLLLSFGSVAQASGKSRTAAAKPTVVLVHGAWADGSSWDGVVARLQRDGYTVDVSSNPLRGVACDSAYLASYLKTVTGPIILAGHSYGGMVITNAATGNAAVKALATSTHSYPPRVRPSCSSRVPSPGRRSPTQPRRSTSCPSRGASGADTDLYVKPSVYRADFGADLSVQQDAILAATQEPLATSALQEPSGPPAWNTIRSFALIGTQDMVLPPAEQVFMAARAHATVVKIKASHLGLISHPDTVARLIERAAVATR